MNKKAIFRFTNFSPDDFGHGGMKRSAQIENILVNNNFEIIDLKNIIVPTSTKAKLKFTFFGLLLLFKNSRLKIRKSKFREAQLVGYYYHTLVEQLKIVKEKFEIRYFIWEYTWPKFWFIPLIVKKAELKIVALPHNLESLVYLQKSFKKKEQLSPHWFNEELSYLNECDNIFTISREEQWLLSLFLKNKSIQYLPYYPSDNVVSNLINIKESRKEIKISKDILVLGSVGNEPTYLGMKELKDYAIKELNNKFNFSFVGYEMDKLINSDVKSTNIKAYPNLSINELFERMKQVGCAIIYQIPTTGALTRIIELQIAGIPILVNNHGARSYFNIKGVNVFEDISALTEDLIQKAIQTRPETPKLNKEFYNDFVNTINTK